MCIPLPELRSVFLVDLRHWGGLPREVEDVLDLAGWRCLRLGRAYVLDWTDAVSAGYDGGVWGRIERVVRAARRFGVPHALLTLRHGERIPVPHS